MNRRELMLAGMALGITPAVTAAQEHATARPEPSSQEAPSGSPPTILLNDYIPHSIYKIPVTTINKSKFPIYDAHCHGRGDISVRRMVSIMDEVGVEKGVVFTGAWDAHHFTEISRQYSAYPGRFDMWCMFDLDDFGKPDFEKSALKSLEECRRAGAHGVGEIHDKGRGFTWQYSGRRPRSSQFSRLARMPLNGGPTYTRPPMPPSPNGPSGPHADDPRLDALWDRAGQLGMPISIHVSDPIWSYQKMDHTNDGLMNGWSWRIVVEPGMYDHNQLVDSLDKTAGRHPKTTFIACHLSNLDYDLARLGQMFDRHPNLYADIAARFAETATIPRFTRQFLMKYPDRVVYGTDVTYSKPFFSTTFRILETEDEHFYERGLVDTANFNFNYHWTLNAFGLPDNVLKNIYHDNAINILKKAQDNAA
ncbi:MAG TPA: amidohydrolase family protein [Terriglobia bacterium]|nr:amidohydrolase family protein [Terriglobia bacterium]